MLLALGPKEQQQLKIVSGVSHLTSELTGHRNPYNMPYKLSRLTLGECAGNQHGQHQEQWEH